MGVKLLLLFALGCGQPRDKSNEIVRVLSQETFLFDLASVLLKKRTEKTIDQISYAKRLVISFNKLLLNKRKLYLTYGMVLCLVTLTDL